MNGKTDFLKQELKSSIGPVGIFFVVLLIAAGFFIRQPQISYGLPAVRYPDSVYTVEIARHLANEWKAGHPTLDPKQYVYPTFYIHLLAIGYYVLGDKNPEAFARYVTMLFCLFSIAIVYLIGIEIDSIETGLLASFFLTFGFLFTKEGRYPTTDSVQMFFIALSLLFLFKKKGSYKLKIFVSGFVGGLAMGTKLTAVLYLLPIVLVVSIWPNDPASNFDRMRNMLVWAGSSIIGFILSTPSILFRHKEFIRDYFLNKKIQETGFINNPDMGLLGSLFTKTVIAPETPFPNSFAGNLGYPFAIVGILALGGLPLFKSCRKNPQIWGLVLSALFSYFYFSFCIRNNALRYLLPLAMILVILISYFIVEISKRAVDFIPHAKSFLPFLIGGCILFPNVILIRDYLKALAQEDTRLKSVEWMLNAVPRGSNVLNLMYGPALPRNHYNNIQWHFPEIRSQLEEKNYFYPSVGQLQSNGISWVIWNSFYTDRFFAPGGNRIEEEYCQKWRDFYADLKRYSDPKLRLRLEGKISPSIEIFFIPPS